MSTQPFSSLPENQNLLTTKDTKEHKGNSAFDGPWRVAILPEPEMLPPGVIPGPQPHESLSLPWRPGDVTRLKDDSPEGMMRYIATHTTGWWQDMAERALRDTEKAERMAEELGIQPGQHWTVVVDAEARERMLAAEEAKRVREEAERARQEAAREAFAQRQLELLQKAGQAPRCEYVHTDGKSCRAPQTRGERWCHAHAKMMSYRPEKLEVLPMEDEKSITVNLYRTVTSLLSGAISEKTAALVLWSVAIKAPGVQGSRVIARDRRHRRDRKGNAHRGGAETRRKREEIGPSEHRVIGSSEKQRSTADEGGLREQSALSNQHSANGTVSQHATAAEQAHHARQDKSAEDASVVDGSVRDGEYGGAKDSSSVEAASKNRTDKSVRATHAEPETCGEDGCMSPGDDPGVESAKSFGFGVGGVPPQPAKIGTCGQPGIEPRGKISRREECA